jgi:hypothetical protein
MRLLIILFILTSLYGCTHDVIAPSPEPPPKPFKPGYYKLPDSAIVNVNGVNVVKYIGSSIDLNYQYHPNDTFFHIGMESSVNNYAFYYLLDFGNVPVHSGLYTVHMHSPNFYTNATAAYRKTCCYNFPDQIDSEYVSNEIDSALNYIQMNVDTSERKFSAKLNLVLTTEYSPYDTVRIRCDTLFSRW